MVPSSPDGPFTQQFMKTIPRLLTVASVVVCLLASSTSAMAQPFVTQSSPSRVTFTLDILPRKSIFSTAVWGQVHSQQGACAKAACTYRIFPGKTFRLVEKPLSPKKHPFKYWVLPGGKHDSSHAVTLKVVQDEELVAQFKS